MLTRNLWGALYPYTQFSLWPAWPVETEESIAPSVPPPAQQTIPTSAYGQTIPVIWGKARVPSAYIWAAPIDVNIDGDNVSVKLTARLRFARPLEANSSWRVRRMWASGNLIMDRSEGYTSPLITYFAEYDGQSTQARDPVMVTEEGENEVSAHRGYLDIVITMELGSQANQPPAFDAEWVQDAQSTADVDAFAEFTSDATLGSPALNWSTGQAYIFSQSPERIRRFSLSALSEVSEIPISGAPGVIVYNPWEFIPQLNRILTLSGGIDSGLGPVLISPLTGVTTAVATERFGAIGQISANEIAVAMTTPTQGVVMMSSFNGGYVSIYRFTQTTMERQSLSGASWDARGIITCITVGEIRDDDLDMWVTADDKLYKVVLSSGGAVGSITDHATFTDDPVYCVFYDDDVIVWTDGDEVIRINGSTGATVWTESVPYTAASGWLNTMAEPGHHRLNAGQMFISGSGASYLTSLKTGDTETIAGTSGGVRVSWDSVTQTAIQTTSFAPNRIRLDLVGEGITRDLEDFLAALTEVDEGFTSAEHDEINITDQIFGAVVDVTSGVREVAKSTCSPYSIAIFERGGVIIYKRALTDGSFAVDATITAPDLVDRGGQAIRAKRFNPEEFIARYGINYRDPDEIYQARPQFGEIQFTPFPLSPTDLSVKVDIPIIASATAMKTLATKKVNRLAEERHEFTLGLRAKFLDQEPEDILQFSLAGRVVYARVLETTMNPDFTIELRCTEFLSKVDATVAGATGRPSTPTAVGTPESSYYHLDIPLLSDSHDLGGAGLLQYHVLTSQGQPHWDGATLYRRGGSYVPVSSQVVDGLVGVALSALPDCDVSPYETEFTRTINVAFITGDTSLLSTKTYLQVMNGANKFAIGAPGRWEVCHVIEITDNGDGSFAFTGLVRGRGVSEEHTATHATGDFVVWLSGGNVQNLDYAVSDLNDSFDYKPVGFGGNVTTTPAQSETITGEAEKIPKPAQLDAVIDGSDIDLSWVRCSRIGVYWADDGSDTYTTPLGETLEQYVVNIYGTLADREVTVNNATTYAYSSADQTTDFGAPLVSGDEINWDIRQVSGTGVICPTREVTITL